MSTVYTSYFFVNKLQTDIMIVVDEWAHTEKTPIPYKFIVDKMKSVGVGEPATANALHGLLLKGYIRKACMTTNKTFFVQLKRV